MSGTRAEENLHGRELGQCAVLHTTAWTLAWVLPRRGFRAVALPSWTADGKR